MTRELTASCRGDNDLHRVLQDNGMDVQRCDTPAEAVERAADGTGVLVLADGYPERTTGVDPALFDRAARKKLRLYVEFPSMLPGMSLGQPREHKKGPYGSNLDREVIVSEAFPPLPRMSIVMVKGCRFLPVEAGNPHIVTARVAGYNAALFGLPGDDVWPILFEHPRGDILVATTMLSHFVTGRYAPTNAWGPLWQMILRWLQPPLEPPQLRWTPTVRPTYGRDEPLPVDAELAALRRGVSWYGRSKLFLEPSGKRGFHEGYNSKDFFMDGSHGVSTAIRSDCTGEVAMSLALGAAALGEAEYRQVARNLNDLLFFESQASRGPRLDRESPSYGLIGWDDSSPGVYYGDDAARHLLGGMAAAAALKSDRWDDRAVLDMLANFRTTGPAGFRKARIEEPELQEHGWRQFWQDAQASWGGMRNCPHYQAYLWAVNLWLYDKTHFGPLLDRTEAGIRHLMELLPDGWHHEANRHEPERCRMLLPLAWLVRVADTPEHRRWLDTIKEYVLVAQQPCGAIPQRIIHATTANDQYGTGECALVQHNGDPCTDLLYATNFAFIGLHEAAAATGDPELKRAEDRLADFLVRIQIRSEMRGELDGAWYRGFDYDKWDYWGSDGDIGWGVWSIETGWTDGWITATYALRLLKTSLWDFTRPSRIATAFEKHRRQMLPDDALD
ncbi:MAG: hypothetical protein ABFD92_01305 [Planctomycetaceae bacterium]|nr:hypothetical protein [Planctomycetaceae bacterium]